MSIPGVHSKSETAEMLAVVTESWLAEQARLGRIPHLLIAGKIAFTDAHIEAIIAQFERRPTAQDATPAPSEPRAAKSAGKPANTEPGQLKARAPRRKRVA